MPATRTGLALTERADPVGMALGVCVEFMALFKTEESSKMRAMTWKLNIEQTAESQALFFLPERQRSGDRQLSLSGSKGEKTRRTFILQYSHHEH